MLKDTKWIHLIIFWELPSDVSLGLITVRYVGEKQPVLLDSRIPTQNKPMQLMGSARLMVGWAPLSLTVQTFSLLWERKKWWGRSNLLWDINGKGIFLKQVKRLPGKHHYQKPSLGRWTHQTGFPRLQVALKTPITEEKKELFKT